MGIPGVTSEKHAKLEDHPGKIDVQFLSLLGSGFHRAHRIMTPAKHEFKHIYSVAVSEAAYEWDLDSMMEVYHCVKEHINITFLKNLNYGATIVETTLCKE